MRRDCCVRLDAFEFARVWRSRRMSIIVHRAWHSSASIRTRPKTYNLKSTTRHALMLSRISKVQAADGRGDHAQAFRL
jgi:hypothetical protein